MAKLSKNSKTKRKIEEFYPFQKENPYNVEPILWGRFSDSFKDLHHDPTALDRRKQLKILASAIFQLMTTFCKVGKKLHCNIFATLWHC